MSKTKNKKKLPITLVLLLIGFVPLILVSVTVIIMTVINTTNNLEEMTYDKLRTAAEGLRQYYQYDIEKGVEAAAYEHDYVDMFKSEGMEMTLFLGDTRYITSALNEKGERNEGTQMASNIWAEVSSGKDYYADGVDIGGTDYYVYYVPLGDGNGNVVGSAWAGEPETAVKAAIRTSIMHIVIAIIITVIVAAVAIIWISRKIMAAMSQTVSEIQKLADKNLTSEEVVTSAVSELSQIGDNVVTLRTSLRDIISTILNNANNMNSNMSSVAEGVSTCNEASDGITVAVDGLAKGSVEMAESVQNTNNNMIEMGDNIDHIKELSENANTYATAVKDEAVAAQNELANLIRVNGETVAIAKDVVDGINESAEAVEKISTAASVIESIASQTNLLSLNASIEAARAGEAGKGFAVVAQEISNLADQSNESSKEIKEVVANIIESSKKNVEYAQRIQDAINNEGTVLTDVNNSFTVVNDKAIETANAINVIAGKTDELNEAKTRVLDDVTSLSSISEENAASCQETNASMEEMGATMTTIKEQSDSTLKESNGLKDIVGQFAI